MELLSSSTLMLVSRKDGTHLCHWLTLELVGDLLAEAAAFCHRLIVRHFQSRSVELWLTVPLSKTVGRGYIVEKVSRRG